MLPSQPTEYSFDFDLRIHRLDSVKKAAYRFSAHYEVRLENVADDRVRVNLCRRASTPSWELDPQSFPGDVLDQELRESVATETKGVRDLLLAHAFSGLALIDPVGESADFRDDPLQIAQNRTSAD